MAKKPDLKTIATQNGIRYAVVTPQREKLTHSIADWKKYEENPPTDEEHRRAVLADILEQPYFKQEMQRRLREIAEHPEKCREYTGHDIEELDIHVIKKPE
jgi:hypothetical protein